MSPEQLVRKITALTRFTHSAGVEVLTVEPGRVSLSLAKKPELLQFNNVQSLISASIQTKETLMTRTKHDQFAKELLSGLLETVGIANTEVKVTSEIRGIDLLFAPLSEKAADRDKLGLLGRIAATACIIEPYRNAPGNEDILICILRLVIQRGERQRKANREKQSLHEDDYEMLWVVGPTISQAVLGAFGAQPAE